MPKRKPIPHTTLAIWAKRMFETNPPITLQDLRQAFYLQKEIESGTIYSDWHSDGYTGFFDLQTKTDTKAD